jgi:hypothetical protein
MANTTDFRAEFYQFIAERISAPHPDGQRSVRQGALKMAALFAANGRQTLRERIVDECVVGGLLDCETEMFLPRLQRIIAEVTGA